MPLLHFHMVEGRTEAEIDAILEAAHQAMLEAFSVPPRDRYQIVTEHKSSRLVMEDTGLGFARTEKRILLQVFSRARGPEKTQLFYKLLAERLEAECGIAPTDLMVSVMENGDAHWSFGAGRAQFLTGELGGTAPS